MQEVIKLVNEIRLDAGLARVTFFEKAGQSIGIERAAVCMTNANLSALLDLGNNLLSSTGNAVGAFRSIKV